MFKTTNQYVIHLLLFRLMDIILAIIPINGYYLPYNGSEQLDGAGRYHHVHGQVIAILADQRQTLRLRHGNKAPNNVAAAPLPHPIHAASRGQGLYANRLVGQRNEGE